MRLFMSILLMLGGVGAFLAGMSKMSEGLRQGAGAGVRRLFNKISGNRVAGYGIGVGATAIVQSSSATAIMTVGLANANIIKTRQAAPIILGAKVGTTLTAFIFALSGLSKDGFSTGIVFSSFAFVGVIMLMIVNKDLHKNIATFLLGFGLLFLGLEVMGDAISGSESALGATMTEMFAYDIFMNPVLLIIMGLVFTCIIQSSTAATAIFITFLTTNVLSSVDQAFFLVLGANIGTCADGLMAAIGANANGKRVALFHLITSAMGACLFGILTVIFREPIVEFFTNVIVRREWSLAIFNLTYNTLYTLILLPFVPVLVDLMEKLVKEKTEKMDDVLEYLNPQIMQTPVLAATQTKREILSMGRRAAQNLDVAFKALLSTDTSESEAVFAQENILNRLNREISNYLIKLSSLSNSMADETAIGAFHHVINDIERIGDHAKNFMLLATELSNMQESFIDESKTELSSMYENVAKSLNAALGIFEKNDKPRLKEVSALEEEIDRLHKFYSKEHFKRLNEGSNWAEIQIYYDVLSELERIGDHIVNIAFSIVDPTGQQKLDTNGKKKATAKSKRKPAAKSTAKKATK